MGFLSKLFGNRDRAESQDHPRPVRQVAVVELRSPFLLAFDLPSEGVKYEIPDFKPGLYAIPLEAIVKAHEQAIASGEVIEVDTGTIFFIDAAFEAGFRRYEANLFETSGDSCDMIDNPGKYAESIGIRYDCLVASGLGTQYAFVGDGSYVLDMSKIRKA